MLPATELVFRANDVTGKCPCLSSTDIDNLWLVIRLLLVLLVFALMADLKLRLHTILHTTSA